MKSQAERNAYKLKWASEHRESRQRSCRKWLEEHPERRKRTMRNYYLRHKDEHKIRLDARVAVREGIRKKFIARPDRCMKCGTICTPHGHHHKGYEKEFWLDVIWLCVPCHVAEHR